MAAQPPSIEIGKKRFTYDALFDSNVTQGELFGRVAPPLLASFLEGYNATIMAYGQTGSGKTFTMGSEAHNHGEDTAGIIPRFMESVFHTLKQKKLDSDSASEQDGPVLLDYSISASFLEVYGEDVHDLLDKERKALPLRDDSNGGVVVAGLKRKMVSSAQEALDVLHVGTMNRTTAATLMNLTSSRSHAVFSVYLDQTTRSKEDVEMTTSSKFTFVDLAGSERMKKTGAEGERAREGIKINEGLLALGNVINALGDEERLAKEKKLHVPYRQSKLTRLLQDALGGNSQTFFMACVSPSDTNTNETLSTLRYANRARNIKNAPTKNIDSHTLEIQRLLSLNSIFLSELVKHKFGGDTESLARIDKTVLQQTGVMEYVARLQREAEAQDSACVIALPSMAPPSSHSIIPTASYAIQSVAPNKASTNESPESMDETILEDMNPEEELAILDQLLELQQKEHDYDNEHKEGQLELKRVEGELEEQEIMLLQLKDSLKAYHSMKDKFEILMAEVQQLETEKSSLAVELENAKVDPTKGCSTAIQKKLARIEANLVRARSDARKQQKKCKEAERQAQKCKSLEQKIMQLKQGKANVVKRQRESTARHRQYTESKTREIISLKKKSRTADRKVSKLQAEVQAHKNNLAKRKTYTDKLTSKLKESEKHLMKLLSVRKRDLKERSSLPARRHASAAIPAKEEGFATEKSQELKTIKYFLDRIVTDRNASIQLKIEHDEKVAKYSDIMRKMVAEVKGLDSLRVQLQNGQIGEEELLEAEQAVEDLEVNLELIGGELEILRSKMSATESSEDDILSSQNVERKAKEMIANLASPTLRTLLWGYIDKYSSSEVNQRASSSSVLILLTTISLEVYYSLKSSVETTFWNARMLLSRAFSKRPRH